MPKPIFVALDTPDADLAARLSEALVGIVAGVKLGLEFFNANGPDGVRRIVAGGMPVFLDLKYHDIPNTVTGAMRGAIKMRPAIVNVHALGGETMMRTALEIATEESAAAGIDRPLLIAVTVLTSLDADDLAGIGIAGSAEAEVVRLAELTKKSGLDGVVCSAREIPAIRAACGEDFKLIVPGIRPAGADLYDQKRTMTPAEAIEAGADYLVIGRPITGADDPAAAARAIAATL
jgi:orotidine-5'-phosphate decarboxylase